MSHAPGPAPDTKDWTWVLERPCADCGHDAGAVDRAELGRRIRAQVDVWRRVLARPEAARRPDPGTWSPLEYACHVRDVHRVFLGRVRLVLDQDDPEFANWDQDATALEERYDQDSADKVSGELARAAEEVASAYDAVAAGDDATWARPARRSNGSVFTLESLGRYHLHDVVHHAWDVRDPDHGAGRTD